MITAQQLEVRAGRAAAHGRRLLPGRPPATRSAWSGATAPARPPSPGSSPARRCPRPARSTRDRRGRLPAAGPAHRRPRGARRATGSCPRAASTTSYAGCARPRSEMGSDDPDVRERAMRRYERADAELHAGGGYAAEAEAAQIARSLGHRGPAADPAAAHPVRRPATPRRAGPDPVLRRRDAAARRADQPPRRRLDRLAARVPQGPQGRPRRDQPRHGAARADRQPRCFHLDANRAEIDVYNMGWTAYLAQRETDERRRKRERPNAETQGRRRCIDQANKMRAKATKAQAAQSMMQARREDDGRARGRAARPTGWPGSSSPSRRPAARRR